MLTLALVALALQDPQVFFGNLHSHTSFSDGSGTPEQAYTHARETAKLDFLAITEHSHKAAEGSGETDQPAPIHIARDGSLYTGPRIDGLIPTAKRLTENGKFVALYGQEWSSISKGNHVNVFEIDAVIAESQVPNGEFDALTAWLAAHPDRTGKPALIQFNHPSLHNNASNEYGRDDFGSTQAWRAAIGAHAGLIEVLNGPALSTGTGREPAEVMESDYLFYLNQGFYFAPTGDQDNHFRTWGSITDARTAVLATSLTRDSILEAMRARHVYATEDKNLRIIVRVNNALMGDRTSMHPGLGVENSIIGTIADEDEPGASYRIDVFSDGEASGPVAQIAETINLDGPGAFSVSGVSYTGTTQYVFVRVTQISEDGDTDRAWTAPVWFDGVAAIAPVTRVASLQLESILPNPVGSDFDFEEATIRNAGTAAISLVGWTLRDLSRNTWKLDSLGALAAGDSAPIIRNGQDMAMNNSGEERIELVSDAGVVVDSIRYSGTEVGERIPRAAP